MLKDLLIGTYPQHLKLVKVFHYNWDTLLCLWNINNPENDIHFSEYEHPDFGISWSIREQLKSGEFWMTRSKVTNMRNTIKDDFGLLGLSLINPKDDKVILTEGVSDYFTAKLLCPQNNVLGVTTLGGSTNAKKILLNLFNKFIICSDNDVKGSINTGLNNAQNWKKFLSSFGKSVSIFIPQTGCKDITENFIKILKLNADSN